MEKLKSIGEKAKKLLHEMRAEEAIEILLSASEYINDGSSLNEKGLVDWYAFYALSIKQNRLPIEITFSEREYLDDSIIESKELQEKLDLVLQNLFSWFCELERSRTSPRFGRTFRNPRSKNPKNRLIEIGKFLEKQVRDGLSVDEWESVLAIIEEQFQFILGWCVWSNSTRFIWPTVKSGHYAEYAKIMSEYEDKICLVEEIRMIIKKCIEIEGQRESIQQKFLGYKCKSDEIVKGIDCAIEKFHGTKNSILYE